MKQYKNITAIAVIAMISFFFTTAVKAADDSLTVPVELKFVGSIKNQPLVQLNFFGSKTENEFSVLITDQHGTVLYDNNLNGEKFSQQFLLDTEDLGGAVLNFQITSKRSGKTVSYRVSNSSTTVQQTDIAKL